GAGTAEPPSPSEPAAPSGATAPNAATTEPQARPGSANPPASAFAGPAIETAMGDIDPGLLQDFSIDEFLTPEALTQLTQAADGASADRTLSLLGTHLARLVGHL